VKHLLGEATPAETAQVKQWLTADAGNQAYYDELKKVWETSLQLASVSRVDENKAWQRFRQRIQDTEENDQQPVQVIPKTSFSWMKIAAAVIVVIGLAVLGYWIYDNRTPRQLLAQASNTVVTDTLPDGSVVTLNKASSLSYPSRFSNGKRAVTLKGEAFFHVAPNKAKPFIISVNDIEVTVVGTSFNIRSEKGRTAVIVETGIVRVTRNGKTVELHANEQLSVTAADSLAKAPVTDKLYNYYRTKEFVCENTPLWKLVEVLNEAYQSNIVIGRPELRDLRIDIPLYNESLDRVLDLVSLTLPVKIKKTANQVIIE
jgi:transmembrane sensor